jgi:acyl-coenzyme A synthetase/AMP-(fatty) acid ligase
LQQGDGGWQLHAPHLPSPQPLCDQLTVEGDHFHLLGRSSDLIKVAGKRVSLGELNHLLLAIEGVEDGVFFLPEEGDEARTVRLAAAVVSSRLSNGELLRALREKIDPAFLPRPLLRPTSLPRNETGKLPRHALLQLLQEHERQT